MNEYKNNTLTGSKNRIEHYWNKTNNNNNITHLNEVLPVSSSSTISRFPTHVEFQYARQKHLLLPPSTNSSSSSICNNNNNIYSSSSLLSHNNNNHLFPMTTSLSNNDKNKSLEKQSSASSLLQQQQQQSHVLLHRSPSGAQRKIRQKAQQQFQQQQSGGISGGLMSSQQNCEGRGGTSTETNNNNNKQIIMAYRNLINENGYHSLLGETTRETTINNKNNNDDDLVSLSAGQLIDRMNKLESSISRPQQQQFSSTFDNWQSINNNIGGCSIDKMSSSSSLNSNNLPFQLDQQQQQQPLSTTTTTFAFRKPTVQVHPFPIPPRNYSPSSSSNLICDLLNSSSSPCSSPTKKPPLLLIPPPLPPKKQSLLAKNSSSSPYRSFNNIQKHKVVEDEKEKNKFNFSENFDKNNNINSVNNDNNLFIFPPCMKQLITTEKNNFNNKNEIKKNIEKEENNSSFQQYFPSSSPLFLPQQLSSSSQQQQKTTISSSSTFSSLSNSPSLTSLQNCLNFAIENPEKHSIKQLEELEQRRIELIESLAKKSSDRKQDKELLLNDLDEIKQLCNSLFERIQNNKNNGGIVSRLKIFCQEIEKITDLNILLNCQQERLIQEEEQKTKIIEQRKKGVGKLLMDNELNDEREEWAKRLEEQINDLQSIQECLTKREHLLDLELINEFNNDNNIEALNEWIFCKEQLTKLFSEKRLLDEKLREVEKLINSLKSICLLPPNNLIKTESSEEILKKI